ncbi:uncharacterized protein LOC123873962 [Maniola jurtina]|uniref:uncharacterized protein LOC123873962 n=1 Tax=Maniola jurtina TaxID=191418 RepID=UPI001E688BDD|nr:uncharacterized protein LOC123873962 [Maniola jurtina]
MAGFKSITAIIVLIALLAVCLGQSAQGGPHVSQGGPHQNQGRARRQVEEENLEANVGPNPLNPMNWTTCDVTVIPRISCHDCNTRVICKPIGGLLKSCNDPARPHCNLGICSAVPSLACA